MVKKSTNEKNKKIIVTTTTIIISIRVFYELGIDDLNFYNYKDNIYAINEILANFYFFIFIPIFETVFPIYNLIQLFKEIKYNSKFAQIILIVLNSLLLLKVVITIGVLFYVIFLIRA